MLSGIAYIYPVAQRPQSSVLDAQLFQDAFIVLADLRDPLHPGLDVCAEARREERLDLADLAVDLSQPVAGLELRVVPDILHVVDLGIGDAGFFQERGDLVCRMFLEDAGDDRLELVAVFAARCRVLEFRIRGQIFPLQDFRRQYLPLSFVLHTEHHLPVPACAKWPVGVDARVAGSRTFHPRLALVCVVQWEVHPLHQAFEHGDINLAALSGLLSL